MCGGWLLDIALVGWGTQRIGYDCQARKIEAYRMRLLLQRLVAKQIK